MKQPTSIGFNTSWTDPLLTIKSDASPSNTDFIKSLIVKLYEPCLLTEIEQPITTTDIVRKIMRMSHSVNINEVESILTANGIAIENFLGEPTWLIRVRM